MESQNIFPHFPQANEVCPVCGTRKDTETILVSIPGTERGNIIQGKCVHKKCYDLIIEMNLPLSPEANEPE